MTAQSRSQIVSLLERHGLVPRKAYGQHFLADPNLVRRIVDTAGVTVGDRVVEVGAGTGALTAALAATGAEVIAYELDQRLRPVLDQTLAGMEVDVRYEDVMEIDLPAALGDGAWRLVSNLPYNVGTPLIIDVLLTVPQVVSLTVMVQKEVADRLVAAPSSRHYGVPSVVVALTTEMLDHFQVPPQVFVPVPQVASGVVRLDRREAPGLVHEAVALARTAFGQRRKMLRRSLDGIVDHTAFQRAGIDPTDRPEDLAPEEFVALAEAVARA